MINPKDLTNIQSGDFHKEFAEEFKDGRDPQEVNNKPLPKKKEKKGVKR